MFLWAGLLCTFGIEIHTDALSLLPAGSGWLPDGALPTGNQPWGQLLGTVGAPGWNFGARHRVSSCPLFAVWPEGAALSTSCITQNSLQGPQTPVWWHEGEGDFTGLWPGYPPTLEHRHQALFHQVPITMVLNVTRAGKMDPQSSARCCAQLERCALKNSCGDGKRPVVALPSVRNMSSAMQHREFLGNITVVNETGNASGSHQRDSKRRFDRNGSPFSFDFQFQV